MEKPRIAVVSFPGNNCEVESIRAVKQGGMEVVFVKWNDPVDSLESVDGFFLPGGFSYEDRGRAGMVPARDPMMAHIIEQAAQGKVVIGNCNGAQVLVESGLIPLDRGLAMSLARNAVDGEAVGFLNEWVWITPTCARDRCATSDWEGVMHLPIAHGEGRFVTKDMDLIEELKKNDQLAFSYCDASRRVSDKPPLCPNGSLLGIAGICNPAGNVVALMPHPERTQEGLRYFLSMRRWIERRKKLHPPVPRALFEEYPVAVAPKRLCEIFIDTIITNNEERTVEQAARRIASTISLKQLKYFAPGKDAMDSVLTHLSLFNPNKEIAYIRREGKLLRWNPDTKREEPYTGSLLEGAVLLRIDEPDTGASQLGEGSMTGICYVCSNIDEQKLYTREVLEVFANPHASHLLKMQ